jgi:branched-chain amino acid transport system permease protein
VALFAISLDIILGYTGIVSLGHAAFFGLGGYAAALFAKHVMPDPLVGLAVGIAAATLLGLMASLTILRGSDLTRLMVTLGLGLILMELANKLDWLTGGADGLQGVVMGPILGRFEFDLSGQTAAYYSLSVLLIFFVLLRRVTQSPLGATLMAIRDNRLRAMSIGIPVNARLTLAYTLAAAVAGAAGALMTQTTGFASLDLFEFHRSADVLLILVIGGTGWLYGGAYLFGGQYGVRSAWASLRERTLDVDLLMVLFGSVVEVSVLKVLSGFHSAVGHTGIYIYTRYLFI